MSTADSRPEVPPRVAAAVVAFALVTALYAVAALGSLTELFAIWFWALSVALSLFVVYLLYRFVVAVETIAEKL